MAKWISLLVLILSWVMLGAQEIIFEHYAQGTDFWLILPYNTISFKKDASLAQYQVTVEIRNSKKKQVASYSRSLELPKKAWLMDSAIPVRFEAKLEPGKYELTLQLRNLALGDKTKIKKSFGLGDYTKIGQAYLTVEREGISYMPSSLDGLTGDIQSCDLVQKFSIDADSVMIQTDKYRLMRQKPASPIQTSLLGEEGLPSHLEIVFFERNIRYRMEPFMYSPWFSYNLRYSIKDQLAQLRYLANQNQWKSLSTLPEKKLADGIELFWQANDPSPGTIRNEAREDFYRRVLVADELYSLHKKIKGWSSDRGRIFIKFGYPDEIIEEVHPLDEFPSIRWLYYKEKKEFIFSDTGGFGQYTLRNKDEEYKD